MPLNAVLVPILNQASSATATSGTTNVTVPVRTDERGIGSERFGAGKRVILNVERNASDVAGTMAGSLGTVGVYGADLPSGFGTPATPVLGNAFGPASAASPNISMHAGDGTATTFQTNIPFVALANNNWIVETLSFKLTGTVTVAAGVVTGAGTNFDPEIDVGDTLVLGGQSCVVTARTSDTAAVVSPAITVSAGGIGYNNAQNKRTKQVVASASGPQQCQVSSGAGALALITFAIAPPTSNPTSPVPGAQAANIAVYFVTVTELLAIGANTHVKTGIRGRTMVWTNWAGDVNDDFSATLVDIEVSTAS